MLKRLTVVRATSGSHDTTAEGYYAEDMLDKAFNEAIKHPSTLMACVWDGAVRRIYVAPELRGRIK